MDKSLMNIGDTVTDPDMIAQLEGQSSKGASTGASVNSSSQAPISFVSIPSNVKDSDINVPAQNNKPIVKKQSSLNIGDAVTDPTMIAQLENKASSSTVSSQKNTPWSLGRVGGDLTGGFLDLGQGLLNAPYDLINQFSPSTAQAMESGLPDWLKHQTMNFQSPKTDQSLKTGNPFLDPLLQSAGQSGNQWQDQVLQGLTHYMPYAVLGGAIAGPEAGVLGRMGGQAAGGAAYGATQSSTPLTSAVEGGLVGAATSPVADLASTAISKLVSPITNRIAKMMVEPTANDMENSYLRNKETLNQSANSVYANTKQNYEDNYLQKSKDDWKFAKGMASVQDTSPHIRYNDKGRQASLDKQINDQQKLYNSTPTSENAAGLKLLKSWRKAPIRSYGDLIDHAQEINKSFGKEIEGTGSPASNSLIKHAIKDFYSNSDQQIKENSITPEFNKAWNRAKDSTTEQHETFNEVRNQDGTYGSSKFKNFYENRNKKYQDVSTLAEDYLPKGNEQGTDRFEQFEKMVGNPSQARDLLKKQMLLGAKNPEDVLKKYQSISPEQRNHLYSADEQTLLNGYSNLVKMHPNMMQNKSAKTAFYHTLSFITKVGAGIGLGKFAGADILGSAMLGGAALTVPPLLRGGANIAAKGISKIPGVKNAVISRYANNPQNANILSKLIGNIPVQGYTVPGAIRNNQNK